ncbi:hypothetical protein ARAM_006938 [Aspergillus rambellii]|uniref:Membrane insertase YidC/Oxa/ALB C-terminal domain-containing protein n=1 Tax=Aspergillus rambellii TaxID=308745 RepID=A0A0F8VGS9_9EURO|nr:hypothetical protein ARAM_006938 [Aspergillus rambellii]
MLGGYGLKGRGVMPAIARQRLAAFSRSSRSMSSFRPQSSPLPVRYGRLTQTLAGKMTWRPASAIPGVSATRCNSTATSSASASSAVPAVEAASSANAAAPVEVSDLAEIDITAIPEQIGYLKQLGLDYGWGPSSMIEYFVEHFHIWGGLPWWASIVATGVLVRLALLGPMFGAADTATKINNIKHISTPIRTRMMHHARESNQIEMNKARVEMQKLHQDHGVKPWKSFVPLIQIPFGFGCYRVVKGMASLPVPGLAVEHVAWIQDLTVSDPYYILPAATSLFMYLSFKKGGESGTNEFTKTSLGKMFLYGLPSMSFAFMSFFPSALQIYFATTGLFALGQSYLINSPAFRRVAGIAIATKPAPAVDPTNPLASQGGSEQSRALRMLTEALEAENAKLSEGRPATPGQELSFIDRAIESLKQSKDKLKRETTEKVNEMRGDGPLKNADGTLAEPPRLSEKDRKLAADYEKRRKEEEDWKREERNHARREAHLRALDLEREKARAAFKPKAKQR